MIYGSAARHSSTLTVLALVTVGPCTSAWAADGDLDLAFGTNGIVSTPIDSHAFAVQDDGRIIVVGSINGDFGVVRYNADGWLDVTFGQSGLVQTDLGDHGESARAVVILGDGRILVGGTGLVRYHADGSLDMSFGTGGVVTGVPADDIAIRPDGTIVTAGSRTITHLNSQGGVEFTSTLAQIRPYTAPPPPRAECVFAPGVINAYKILPNGQLAVAGSATWPGGLEFFVARYNDDGTPDLSFGCNGGVATFLGITTNDAAYALVEQDAKIIAAGTVEQVRLIPPNFVQYFHTAGLVQYSADGLSHRSVVTFALSTITSLALQLDGKIIAVGRAGGLALARYLPNGGLDPTFGTGGIVITDVSPEQAAPRDVTIQLDGKILVAGGGILARYLGTTGEDVDPPVIECDEPDGLWHAANVTLACAATDSGSGLANAEDDAHFTLRTNVAVGDEWPNAFTDSRQICDDGGHCATAGPIGGNMIDLRPPTVAVSVPTAGSTFTLGQRIDADYACHDAGSGIQSCIGTVPDGTPVNTSSVGVHTLEVTGFDAVGNSARATSAYTVSYGICPRYDMSQPRNSGSTLPIKLQLCNASGANVSSPTIVVTALRIVLLSSSGEVNLDDSGHANPRLEFRFSDAQYILNSSLKGFAAGTYGLQLKAGNDPTIHTVQFEVK